MKELRFHPYYREMIVTTAEDSYNIFRPNLEPEDDDELAYDSSNANEESKASDITAASKTGATGSNYYIDSDDEEEEELRMVKAAKKLNKQRNDAKDKKNKDGKRRKMEE